ncbi:unnamed protein product, partial [Nesidiocoris tenuis]
MLSNGFFRSSDPIFGHLQYRFTLNVKKDRWTHIYLSFLNLGLDFRFQDDRNTSIYS